MGKPTGRPGGRKKNAGVGVDFKRAKHRVGKKLPRAQNQTDTSFKSRTISLAEQSLATDKDGQAVTGRNLTLKDLLGQCGHYSERVRRDAMQGLVELLNGHPEELRRHTTLVVEAAAARISDSDAAVRAAARELLEGTLLPALGGHALAPFLPLFMAHVCAAMTHLADQIRADALGFLELLMGARPDLVAAGFLAPVLHHFSDQLSRGSRGRSISAGSLASLQAVVAALERILSAAATALHAPVGGIAANNSGGVAPGDEGEQQQQQQQPAVLLWRRCQWPPLGAAAGGSSGVAAGLDGGGGGGRSAGTATVAAEADADSAAVASATLLGHLLECWSEAGPSQLAEVPELVSAQCLTSILRCCGLLLGHGCGADSLAGSSQDRSSLAAAIIRKVAPHFPLYRPTAAVAPLLVDQLVQLNVAAAQLLARFLPSQQPAAVGVLKMQPGAGIAAGFAAAVGELSSGSEEPWVGRLLDWFAGVMADGAALPTLDGSELFGGSTTAAPGGAATGTKDGKQARGGERGSSKRRRSSSGGGGGGREAALPGEVYQSALDGTLVVLPLLPPARRRQLLGAAWALWQRTSPRSGVRPRLLSFWQSLLHSPAAAFHAPTPGGGPLLQHADVAAWLAALPRFLFELGGGNPAASQAALALLAGVARCTSTGAPLAAALLELQPQLAPLWAVVVPASSSSSGKGKAAAAAAAPDAATTASEPRVLVGPLVGLPLATQEQAADLLYHFPAATVQLLRAAAAVALGGAYPTSTAVRLFEVLAARAAAGAAEPAAFCGLLLNLLSGSSSAGLRQCSWQRHAALVAAACSAALRLGDPAAVAAALLPPMLEACADSGNGDGSWATYGLLHLIAALAPAAAVAQQPLQLPAAVVAALPRLILQPLAGCWQGAGDGGGGDSQLPRETVVELCLQLVCLLPPNQLLQPLLEAVPGSLVSQIGAEAGGGALLSATLHLLQALLQEQRLRLELFERQAAVRAALEACKAPCEAVGGATEAGAAALVQLRHLEALCGAVLGG
ncbi:Testis-expressed protein 10 [Chlorella vulgaris]